MAKVQFDHLEGNEEIKSYLQRLIDKKIVPNSILFFGPEGVGKGDFATAFANALIASESTSEKELAKLHSGSHPDIHHYHPQGKLGVHTVDHLREFMQDVSLTPAEGNWKIFIIHDAHRMLRVSANALLKTFEEPAPDSIIILIAPSPDSLLSTIVSRCRQVRFKPLDGAVMTNLDDQVRHKMLMFLARGGLYHDLALKDTVAEIAATVEKEKQEAETQMREQMKEAFKSDLTAVQAHAIEKEVEGIMATKLSERANEIFSSILHWYRDLHLLHVNGKKEYLVHHDYEKVLVQVLQRGHIPTMEAVQKFVGDAQLALKRSMPFKSCLEVLLLELAR